MPYTVQAPELKDFTLPESDARQGVTEEEKTVITVRQARVKENSRRSELFKEYIREVGPNGSERIIYNFPLYNLVVMEIFLTLVGCNIMMTVGDEKEKKLVPLFKFKNGNDGAFLDMNLDQFRIAIGRLDDGTLYEIHDKVLQMNPHWIIGAQGDSTLGEEL